MREQFCAVLASGPLLRADAIVVLCGEDGASRLDTCVELLRQQAAPTIVLSGGLDQPPRILGASRLASVLYGKGVSPGRVLVEIESQNTREQAVIVVAMAQAREWRRLLLVVSPYHAPRAFLTFVRALQDVGAAEAINVLVVPAASSWFAAPEGASTTRLALLTSEFAKVEEYGAHVATYEEGIQYLAFWEAHR